MAFEMHTEKVCLVITFTTAVTKNQSILQISILLCLILLWMEQNLFRTIKLLVVIFIFYFLKLKFKPGLDTFFPSKTCLFITLRPPRVSVFPERKKLRICFLLSQLQRQITRKVSTLWRDTGRSQHNISCRPRFWLACGSCGTLVSVTASCWWPDDQMKPPSGQSLSVNLLLIPFLLSLFSPAQTTTVIFITVSAERKTEMFFPWQTREMCRRFPLVSPRRLGKPSPQRPSIWSPVTGDTWDPVNCVI